jgi:hypothetical protein
MRAFFKEEDAINQDDSCTLSKRFSARGTRS